MKYYYAFFIFFVVVYIKWDDLQNLNQIEQIKDVEEKNKKLAEFVDGRQIHDLIFLYTLKMIDSNLKTAYYTLEDTVTSLSNLPALLYNRITRDSRIQVKSIPSQINFANYFGGATILTKSKQLVGVDNILVDNQETYMITECNQERLFFIICLKEEIQLETIYFINKEFYSSTIKNFKVFGSIVYPTQAWDFLQAFESEDVNDWQSFEFESHFLRYLKIEIIDFHQAEYHCTLTQIRVFGQTVIGDLIQSHKRYKLQLPKIEPIKEEIKQPQRIKMPCSEIISTYSSTNNSTCSYFDYIFDTQQSRIDEIENQNQYLDVIPFESNQSLFKVTAQNIVILSHNLQLLKEQLQSIRNHKMKEKQNQKQHDYIQQQLLYELSQQQSINKNLEEQIKKLYILTDICVILICIILIMGICWILRNKQNHHNNNRNQQIVIQNQKNIPDITTLTPILVNGEELEQQQQSEKQEKEQFCQLIYFITILFKELKYLIHKQLMFPSKLYDLQLTPSLNKFNSDFQSAKLIESFRQLLIEDDKEIVTSAMDLMKAISYSLYGTWFYWKALSDICQGDDLNTISQQLERKIIIYDICEVEDLKCQVINFGYKKRIYLARYLNYFYVVGKKGTSEKHKLVKDILMDVINEIIGLPIRRHKRSYSDALKYLSDQKDNRTNKLNIKNVPLSPSNISRTSLQMQLLDEVNQESDLLLKECNSLINTPTTQNDLLQSLNLNLQEGTNILSNIRYFGTLKFYDEARSYGFIIMDMDGSDLFVHCDDLTKAGMSKDFLRTAKHGNIIRFSFLILEYFGKYNKSRKAVDLQFIQGQPYFM
ncbi:unnamed protein product [Paramecium octaurelia]|uniref:CSD domain-containing protein n=1 Tax=Paramecium octaurelia TaxID=43137 RepID=A0A8S1XLK0_PAROT|nr:unnamed protein product [Paramecium octaurelia]